jgi:hypothetical protein
MFIKCLVFLGMCKYKKQYERNSKQLNFILNQINFIIYSYQHSMKKYLPRVFKFYQPKATGGGFLIFQWTLPIF